MKDSNDLEITTSSSEVISAADKFRAELLSMGGGVTEILTHAENYPESALIQAYAACLFLYGQTKESDREAHKYLVRAKSAAEETNDRERLFLSSLESWHEGRLEEASRKLENLIREWPRDLVSAKVLEFLYYLLGQQYSGPRFLKTMESIYEPNKNSGYFLSSYSFATELCGRYEQALTLAERAVELEEINPWAHHTLSHVLLKRGNISSGTRLLENYRYVWERSGQAIKSHNYWHLALMYLENLEHDKAFSFIHSEILKDKPYLVIQHLDAISLLWRLEMAGFEVPYELWKSIADITLENSGDFYVPFNSAHYTYALARAGKKDELAASMSVIKKRASEKTGHEGEVWNKTGIPLLEACRAYALGNYTQAALFLEPVIDDVVKVGGSDAQDDLFRQAYLLSLIKSGNKQESKTYLNDISTSEVMTPLQNYWKSLI
ncbi:MAG: tetratricopeptide repeat protein [Deltaproteobacteria bacterium]